MDRNLHNTFKKLNEDKRLTIGYFGGSITEGSGASDPSTSSWRPLITSWLRQNYPNCTINEVQAAIGGCGSDLGAYRCESDLLIWNPDLVFIEFAVNDYRKDENRAFRSIEGIIRQILRKNDKTEIVFIYTIGKEMEDDYKNNVDPHSVALQQSIADYYGLPSINVGKSLFESINAKQSTWEELLPDATHPSDMGHKFYADEIKDFLLKHLVSGETVRRTKERMSSRSCDNGRLVDAWELFREPWKKDCNSLANRYKHMLVCNTVNAELEYSFTGRAIGLYWMIAPDSGDIEWSIDSGKPKRMSSWDRHALYYARAGYHILDDNLPEGKHILSIKILKDNQPESIGNWIRIGAILVE